MAQKGSARAGCSLKGHEPEAGDGDKPDSGLTNLDPVPPQMSKASRADLVTSARLS